jgi:hypothetical protein
MPDPDLPASSPRTLPRPWLWTGIFVWVVALGFGMRMLAANEFSPGAAALAPSDWPAKAPLKPDGVSPTLVLFVHPQCPCSRATVAELARILGEVPNRFTAAAFVYSPASELATWSKSDLAERLRALPGVRVVSDPEGAIAAVFGAQTSGQVMLFGRHGDLQFSGGITGSRGHEGDNAGHRAVVARITGRETGLAQASVFGCSIRDEMMPLETKP